MNVGGAWGLGVNAPPHCPIYKSAQEFIFLPKRLGILVVKQSILGPAFGSVLSRFDFHQVKVAPFGLFPVCSQSGPQSATNNLVRDEFLQKRPWTIWSTETHVFCLF
uniref:Uncharacterized protein n=1 Tax=Eutreptiella gymnastica TaxID=73025 RepID=A0A7S1NSR6_9EUGL